MITSKIRITIIAAAAALSVVSLGPMTSLASARPKITVEHVEQLCVHVDADGTKVYSKEGTKVTVVTTSGKSYEMECKGGTWVPVATREISLPTTNQETTSITQVGSSLP